MNPGLGDLRCLENIGICDYPFVNSDEKALEYFNETIKLNDGRYQVTWPWKGDVFSLSDSYSVAKARMKMLIHRPQAKRTFFISNDDEVSNSVAGKE